MEIKRTVKYESNPFIYVQVAGGSDGSLKLDFCHERFWVTVPDPRGTVRRARKDNSTLGRVGGHTVYPADGYVAQSNRFN